MPPAVIEELHDQLYKETGMKVEPASNKEVGSPDIILYVEHVLEVLGYPEALVTDESQIWDFIGLDSEKEESKQFLEKISEKLGFQVLEKDYIVDVAKKLKEKNESKNRS